MATLTAGHDVYRWTRMGDLPRKGWLLRQVVDLELSPARCAWRLCGFPVVRYVHQNRQRGGGEP
jgi:hypothetical protein